MANIFFELGTLIIIAALAGYIARIFRQPEIPAYILAGILIGPVLHLIEDPDIITTLAEIGIAFLLFTVGLELDLKKLKHIGRVASIGSILHIGILFGLGIPAGLLMGFNMVESVYIGLILAFSSTMIVIKLLSDKRELDTLHGRIVIGFLLMQDLLAIIALSILAKMDHFSFIPIFVSLAQAIFIILVAVVISRYFFPTIFRFAASSKESLFLMSVSVCFIFSMIFHEMGFSIVIGAFIAGITLGNLPYNIEIAGRIKSLKDFFGLLFFVSIGTELVNVNFEAILVPLIVITLFSVLVVPIVTIFICHLFGYTKKTAFMAGITLAQISEFSFIIVIQGREMGHIGEDIFSLTVLSAIITFSITTYLIRFDDALYRMFYKPMRFFERFSRKKMEFAYLPADFNHKVILIGCDRLGYSIYQTLQKLKKDFVIVDLNPELIKRFIKQKVPCVYGDIGDPELIERLNPHKLEMIISTIPDHADNALIIKKMKQSNKHATVILTALNAEEALTLYELGADYVIVPHFLGGEHVALLLEDIHSDFDKIIRTKLDHISALKERRHRHPHHK